MSGRWLYTHFPRVRQALTRLCYEYISYLDRRGDVLCLNYGYAPADEPPLPLAPSDERHRYQLQLYHHLASAIDWTGLDALEVSAGRGGGAEFIHRCFTPRSFLGVDFSARAVEFCRRHYAAPGLSFAEADAEALPFPDGAFDVVLNLEASLYYPHCERFLAHVARVLRPNGYFLYADMRHAEDLDGWRAQIRASGLCLLREEDLTPHVVRSLALDRERLRRLVQRHVPRLLHGPFYELAGVPGGNLARGVPAPGERVYRSFVLQKPGESVPLAARPARRRASLAVAELSITNVEAAATRSAAARIAERAAP